MNSDKNTAVRKELLLTPDGLLTELWHRITPAAKLAFFSGAVFAVFTHLYYFTGRFSNEDDLHRILPPIWNLSQGRWADGLKLATAYPLPAVLFFFTVIVLALTVCLTVSVLHIKKPLSVVLTALGVVSFPTLAYSFGYLYGTEQYVLALFFAALAVWVTKTFKWGFAAGMLFLAYSLAQYQSYLAYAMGLCACSLVLLLLDRETPLPRCGVLLAKYAAMGAGGTMLYLKLLNLFLRLTGTELGQYKGISTIGQIPSEEIPQLLQKTYSRFFGFLTGTDFFGADRAIVVCYWICIVLAAVLLLHLILRNRAALGPVRILSALALISLLPICLDIVDFAAPKADASALNAYAFVLIFLVPLALRELDSRSGEPAVTASTPAASIPAAAVSWVLLLATLAVSWSFVVHTNLYYSKISYYYEYTTAFYNRVLARVEALPGYKTDMPVAIISDQTVIPYGDDTALYSEYIIDDQGLWGRFAGLEHGLGNESAVTQKGIAIMRNSLGVSLTGNMTRQINEIKATAAYKNMGIWPESDSTALINGTAVVNFLIELESSAAAEDGVLRLDTVIDRKRFPDAVYTWYVYRDGELAASGDAGTESRFEYPIEAPGVYYGRCVVDVGSHKWLSETNEVDAR